MNLCKDCRINEECCLDKRPKSDCFFYSETEEHRIRNSKEYQQGRAEERKKIMNIVDSAEDMAQAMYLLGQYIIEEELKEQK